MQTQTEQQQLLEKFNRELCKNMGFGRLKSERVTCENGKCYAEYFDDFGNRTHTIEYDGEAFEVQHYEGEEKGNSSWNISLQQGFITSFWHMNLGENVHFKNIQRYIEGLGNIHVRTPVEDENAAKMIYFPAGFIFHIYLVLTSENRHLIDQFQKGGGDAPTNIFHITKQRVYLLTLDLSMNIQVESVELAMLLADMPNLMKYMDMIHDSGIILQEKKYQALVELGSMENLRNPLPTFLGSIREGHLAFGWLKQAGSDQKIDAWLKHFRANATKLIKEVGLF